MLSVRFALIFILWLTVGKMSAQSDHVFKMTKENGHFYVDTSVNGVRAKLMFETGVPGFMIGDAFYAAHKESLGMDVKPCNEKIRYLGGLHNVTGSAQARLRIGEAIFEGPVKIVEGNADLKLPIHLLHHAADSSRIVRMDLKNSEFRVIDRAHLQELIKDVTPLDISFNKWNMPMVNTKLSMKVEGRNISITGNFIADMGNAALLFLNKSAEEVVKWLNDSGVSMKEARDKKGKLIAEGLYADKLTICDRKYNDVSVGVHPFKSMDEYGILGLKFFTMPTIFDFSNHKMYLCKE